LRFLVALAPAVACAGAMFLCLRMMRHNDMPADGHAETPDVDALRKEVAELRGQLAREQSGPPGGASEGGSAERGLEPVLMKGTPATHSTGDPHG
jgi:hypothetical protein